MTTTDVATSEQAERVLAEVVKDSDKTLVVEPHEDRTKELKTPGFSRMRTEWDGPDGNTVRAVRDVVDGRILMLFPDAYAIMNEVYEIVREPEVDEATGDIKTDRYGFSIWLRTITGAPIEDFTKMTVRQREDLLFKITTRLFEWEQKAADLWGEAMFAKAQWEEAMAIGYDSPVGKLTIDDRMQKGRLASRDERYFAIFLTLLSRKADAICRATTLLAQRLKDTLP